MYAIAAMSVINVHPLRNRVQHGVSRFATTSEPLVYPSTKDPNPL